MELFSVKGVPKPVFFDGQTAQLMTAEAYSQLKIFAGSDAFKATVAWIEALAVQTQTHMTNCNTEKLPEAQVRLKQLMAMHRALTAPGGATTGFIF